MELMNLTHVAMKKSSVGKMLQSMFLGARNVDTLRLSGSAKKIQKNWSFDNRIFHRNNCQNLLECSESQSKGCRIDFVCVGMVDIP